MLKKKIKVDGHKITTYLICVILAGGGGWFVNSKLSHKETKEVPTSIVKEEKELNTFTVEEILIPASELTSLKYSYKDVGLYSKDKKVFGKTVPFTTDEYIYTYSGVVNAGIDLSEVKYQINNDKKTITIVLPEPQIFSHEIDENSFEFYDVKDSVFTEKDLGDFTDQRAELKEEIEKQLKKDEKFYNSVSSHAENVLINFLTVAESTKDYTVIFTDKLEASPEESSADFSEKISQNNEN